MGIPRLDEKSNTFSRSAEVIAISNIVSRDGEKPHDTLCISCASGCAVGCRFCATGESTRSIPGSNSNFDEDEMVGQVTTVRELMRQQNPEFGSHQLSVAFMGKGEPGLNPLGVMDAYATLMRAGIVHRGTIATTGKPQFLYNLAAAYRSIEGVDGLPPPYLQLSLAAPLAGHKEILYHAGKHAPVTPQEVLKTAREVYSPLFPKPTQISVRFTLMGFPGGTNYQEDALREMVALVRTMNESQPLVDGTLPFYMVVAKMNETTASKQNGLTSVSDEEVERTVAAIREMGVYARPFAGATGKGSCGTMSGEAAK